MNLRQELYPYPIIITAIVIKNKEHIIQIFKEFLIRDGLNKDLAIQYWKLVFINKNYITHGCCEHPLLCKYTNMCIYLKKCMKAWYDTTIK